MGGAPLDLDGSSARMRSEGSGFAASIYEAMPERGFLVTSHSYDTSGPLEKGRAEGAG